MDHLRRTWLLGLLLSVSALTLGCESNGVLRLRGWDAYQRGDMSAAGASFTKAIDQDPTDWRAQYYLGLVNLNRGQWLQAQQHLDLAYTSFQEGYPKDKPQPALPSGQPVMRVNTHTEPWPERADIQDALAESLFQQGATRQLVGFLNDTTDLRTATSRDYLRKGRYIQRLGDNDAAHLAYSQAIKAAPAGDALPYLGMADFWEKMGDQEKSLGYVRQAYTVNPQDRQVLERMKAVGLEPGPSAGMTPEK